MLFNQGKTSCCDWCGKEIYADDFVCKECWDKWEKEHKEEEK